MSAPATTERGNIEAVLSRFECVRKNGDGWTARCRAHDDKTPSLSISEADGKVLLHCHAGCTPANVVSAAGLTMADLFVDSPQPRIVAIYDYRDESGQLLSQVVRSEPKSFRQRRPDGKDGWTWNVNGVRRIPYHLPEVLTAENVLVCEGEKDCDTAHGLDLTATCNPGGAGKWRDEYSEYLRGKHVAVIADADEAGRKHAAAVAESLRGKAASVKVLELPGAKDLSEWIERGGTKEVLLDVIANSPQYERSQKKQKRIEVFDCADFLRHPFTDSTEDLVQTIVQRGGATLLFAKPKYLKSWIVLDTALCAATGRPALGHFSVASPRRVLLVQVEDRPPEVQKRIAALIESHGARGPAPGMLQIIPRCPLNLLSSDWRDELEEAIEAQKSEIVFLDVFRRLFRGDVLSARDTALFLEVLDAIRDKHGCAIVLAHHSKKATTGDTQTDSLGSINLPAWGDVLLRLDGKEVRGETTCVELNIETKSEQTPEPLTIVLDPKAKPMLRVQSSEGGNDFARARNALNDSWTASDLERALGLSPATAHRRVQVWLDADLIARVENRARGQAVYRFRSNSDSHDEVG